MSYDFCYQVLLSWSIWVMGTDFLMGYLPHIQSNSGWLSQNTSAIVVQMGIAYLSGRYHSFYGS